MPCPLQLPWGQLLSRSRTPFGCFISTCKNNHHLQKKKKKSPTEGSAVCSGPSQRRPSPGNGFSFLLPEWITPELTHQPGAHKTDPGPRETSAIHHTKCTEHRAEQRPRLLVGSARTSLSAHSVSGTLRSQGRQNMVHLRQTRRWSH